MFCFGLNMRVDLAKPVDVSIRPMSKLKQSISRWWSGFLESLCSDIPVALGPPNYRHAKLGGARLFSPTVARLPRALQTRNVRSTDDQRCRFCDDSVTRVMELTRLQVSCRRCQACYEPISMNGEVPR